MLSNQALPQVLADIPAFQLTGAPALGAPVVPTSWASSPPTCMASLLPLCLSPATMTPLPTSLP